MGGVTIKMSDGGGSGAESSTIFSSPASLQAQCMLYVVGNLLDIPTIMLSWLPLSMRLQLLLLLPAVDVCLLERTPLIADISVDEVWETLYRERVQETAKLDSSYETPDSLRKEKELYCTWKEAYFIMSFSLKQDRLFSLLCTVYSCSSDTKLYSYYNAVDIYQCFKGAEAPKLSHGMYSTLHPQLQCPRLIPQRYSSLQEEESFAKTFIEVLATACQVPLRHVIVSYRNFKAIWQNYLQDPYTLELLSMLLYFVESIYIEQCYDNGEEDSNKEHLEKILDIVFIDNECPVKVASITSHFEVVCPYLLKCTSLKQLEMNANIIQPEHQELVVNVLKHHQELEKVVLKTELVPDEKCDENSVLKMNDFIQCISDLLYRPVFKELSLDTSSYSRTDFDVVLLLLRQFFSTPYPVSLSLSLSCPNFDPLPEPLTANTEQRKKSLLLRRCHFSSNLFSCLPLRFPVKAITLDDTDDNTLHSFANLIYIKAEVASLSHEITEINAEDVGSLICAVTAKLWHLSLSIVDEKESVYLLVSALSCVLSYLQSFKLRNTELSYDTAVQILEAVFYTLSPARLPYFDLSISLSIDKQLATTMYTQWKKCGSIKLKRLELLNVRKEDDECLETLSNITEELVHFYA